jgi:hypothetical protein
LWGWLHRAATPSVTGLVGAASSWRFAAAALRHEDDWALGLALEAFCCLESRFAPLRATETFDVCFDTNALLPYLFRRGGCIVCTARAATTAYLPCMLWEHQGFV